MARFDVFRPTPSTVLVDVQAHTLEELGRRVVVPLIPRVSYGRPIADLQPVLEIGAESFVLMTQRIGSVPKSRLGHPVGNIAQYRDEITRALDVLFIGF